MVKNKISQLQLISIGACYVFGTIIVSVFISSVAQNDSWLIGIIAGIFFIPALLIYFSLNKKHPGKSLLQINEAVFGKILGKGLSFLYLIFFLSLCALNVLEASNFLYYFTMPDTPLIIIAIFLMATCVYCVRKGIATLARVSTIFLIFASAGLIFNIVMSLQNANFDYLLPMFNHEFLDYVQSVHIAHSIPFGENLFFLMLIPDLHEKVNFKKSYIIITIITMALMTVIHFREVITLGPLVGYATNPSFEAVRMIDLGGVLSRLESIFALLLVSLTFFKILILFYVCVKCIMQIFNLKTYRSIINMLAIILIVYAIEAYGSSNTNIYFGKNVSPFIWSFFTLILPLFTLIAACIKPLGAKIIKKLPLEKKAKTQQGMEAK